VITLPGWNYVLSLNLPKNVVHATYIGSVATKGQKTNAFVVETAKRDESSNQCLSLYFSDSLYPSRNLVTVCTHICTTESHMLKDPDFIFLLIDVLGF
jgi:hypothetical protein